MMGLSRACLAPAHTAHHSMQRAVREVFDGADTVDDDYFVPKRRKMESVEEDEERARVTDRRFSALPITSVQNPIGGGESGGPLQGHGGLPIAGGGHSRS